MLASTTEPIVDSSPSDPGESDAAPSVSSQEITTPSQQPAPEGLAEVHIIGTKCTDYFTDGTTEYSFPGDPEIHAHIAEKDAPIPTHEGLTWVHSTGQPLYDTPSGDLEEGQYAVQSDGSIIAKPPPFVSSTSTPAVLGASTESSEAPADTSSSSTTTDPVDTNPQATTSPDSTSADAEASSSVEELPLNGSSTVQTSTGSRRRRASISSDFSWNSRTR
jgi:hypothetical protein